MATLYGIGVGPGDPMLLTLKAVLVLETVDVVAIPDSGGEKTAMKIVEPYIKNKAMVFCKTPMTRDHAILEKSHKESADLICSYLDQNKSVGFITLGDPSIYSTYIYIHHLVKKRGYSVALVPGIPSFCAVAATLNTSLCEKEEALTIIPASYGGLSEALDVGGNKVLMKGGRKIEAIKKILKEKGLYEKAQMVSCCSMENETIYESLDDVNNDESYFSIILIKE